MGVVDIGLRSRSRRSPGRRLVQAGRARHEWVSAAQCQGRDGAIWFQSQYEVVLHLDGAHMEPPLIGRAGEAVQLVGDELLGPMARFG
jgi:hypothetical protein